MSSRAASRTEAAHPYHTAANGLRRPGPATNGVG
jgi:hypothetical protein